MVFKMHTGVVWDGVWDVMKQGGGSLASEQERLYNAS